MKIRQHRMAQVSLESMAITDIILNVFIFFFTSFSLVYTFNPNRESQIAVKLPQADVRTTVPSEPISVSIDSVGDVYLNSVPTPLAVLGMRLKPMLEGGQRPVIVRADKMLVFDRVVQVLETVKKAGAERMSLAVEERGGKTGRK